MNNSITSNSKRIFVILTLGLAAAISYQAVQAQRQPPTEHKGVKVASLGVISEESMSVQVGLDGYKMQLREIVLAPAGKSHATAIPDDRGCGPCRVPGSRDARRAKKPIRIRSRRRFSRTRIPSTGSGTMATSPQESWFAISCRINRAEKPPRRAAS